MRTKNPFCTGVQLVVLRTISSQSAHGLGVRGMARKSRLRPDTFANAITKLLRLRHIQRRGYGRYRVTVTGYFLLDCADKLTRYAR